jgi:hypothetical protein
VGTTTDFYLAWSFVALAGTIMLWFNRKPYIMDSMRPLLLNQEADYYTQPGNSFIGIGKASMRKSTVFENKMSKSFVARSKAKTGNR